jgi:hypothetical protein
MKLIANFLFLLVLFSLPISSYPTNCNSLYRNNFYATKRDTSLSDIFPTNCLDYFKNLNKKELENFTYRKNVHSYIDTRGYNLLTVAVIYQNYKASHLLLKNGSDPNLRTKSGYTALHYAILDQNLEIVTLLLLSGANINIATDLGKTPLMLAAQKNRLDIVALLLKKGADINAIDKHSLNAMNYALKSNKINNVDLISQIKSNPFLMLEYNQSGLLKSFVDSIPTAVNWQNENGVSLKSLMSAQKSEKTIPKRKTNIQIKRSIEIPDVENRKLEANTRPYIAPLNPTKKMLSSPLDTCIKNERTNERKENRNKPSNPICLLIFLIQPFDLTRTELKLEAETDR